MARLTRDGRWPARMLTVGHACATSWPRRGICALLPIYAKPLHRLIRELAPSRMVLKAIVRKGCQLWPYEFSPRGYSASFWYLAGLIGSGVIGSTTGSGPVSRGSSPLSRAFGIIAARSGPVV